MLIGCPTCKRHFRVSDASCPFCHKRATRARAAGLAMAAAAALTLPLVGCNDKPAEAPPITADDKASVSAVSAAPANPAPAPIAKDDTAKPTTTAAPDAANPDAANPDAANPDSTANIKPPSDPAKQAGVTPKPIPTSPNYNRPMVARYGMAPRPLPTPKK